MQYISRSLPPSNWGKSKSFLYLVVAAMIFPLQPLQKRQESCIDLRRVFFLHPVA